MAETIKDMESMTKMESDEEDDYGLAEHSSRWKKMIAEIIDAGKKKDWSMAETKSTELIDDIAHVDNEFRMQVEELVDKPGRVILIPEELTAYFSRAQARTATGNLQGAVDDCTETLIMMEAMDEPKNGKNRVLALQIRGKALQKLFQTTKNPQHLEGAIQDCRACWVVIQAGRHEWNETDDSIPREVAQNLLLLLVRKRLMSGAIARPLYTTKEIRTIEQELGLGMFSEQDYRCFECGTVSDTLQRCGGCNKAWFCDTACQRKAWKSGHNKKDCAKKAKRGFVFAPDESRADIEKTFLNDVVDSFVRDDGQPSVIVRDPDTGRYFDPLSDANIYFFPSESGNAEVGLPREILDGLRTVGILDEAA